MDRRLESRTARRPWRLDRRHILRLQLEDDLARWHLFGVAEFLSGQPITPVADVLRRQFPPVPGDSAPRANPLIDYLYAAEGSARSAGTFHFDLGARARFGGPGRSRIFLGISVINLAFGPVAPEVPVPPEELIRPDGTYPGTGVAYRRLFNLPAVPSATLRIDF